MRKLSFILIGVLTVIGVEANAAEFGAPSQAPSASTLTRADVRQQTLRALAAGEVVFGEVALPRASAVSGGRTRDAVRAEARRALAANEVPFGDVALPQVAAGSGGRTRSEVRAETLMALKDRGLAAERDLYAN